MTHTEWVHVMFGAATAAMAAAALWCVGHPKSALRFVWPALAVGIGFFLFLPTETQTRTYDVMSLQETLRSAFPNSGHTWRTWVEMLGKLHVVQHKTAGVLTMMIGAIEFGRVAGWTRRPIWGRLLPYFSIAIGLVLAIHGGGHVHLPHPEEQIHHWVFGFCFVAGGTVLALVQAGKLHGAWRYGWSLLILIAGLDLALLYRVS